MKTAVLLTATLFAATWTASADFSYTTTQKATGGQMAAMAAGSTNSSSKFYLKGQKMKTETGETATILDFDAQTITTINNRQKTVNVRKFSELLGSVSSDVKAQIDVKETGQKKVINGYNASELVLTIQMDSPAAAQMGKMQMEMDMWLSSDPPGVKELRAFYQKNMSRFPWAAMGGGAGNASMQSAMAEMQRKVAEMNGVNVMEVMKMKAAGGAAAPAMPQISAQQMEQMKAAMEKLQAQGGPQAAAAQQAMARMQAMQGGAAGAASGSLMEMTRESTDFSTGSIPDSVFAIPAGYTKVDQK